MGKRKIEIVRIEDKKKRNVTFSKRRTGIFSKAATLSSLNDSVKIAVVVFSPAGKPFSYGHPSVDHVLETYINETSAQQSFLPPLNFDDYTLEQLQELRAKLMQLKEDVLKRLNVSGQLEATEIPDLNISHSVAEAFKSPDLNIPAVAEGFKSPDLNIPAVAVEDSNSDQE